MATPSPSSSSAPSGRDAPFRVATREVSLDFSSVGPDQSPNELGSLNAVAFGALLEKFATIPAVKLIDGDPQLVVTAKRGRYLVVPSTGKLLVRPISDAQQPFEKFDAAGLVAFLGSTDQDPPPPALVAAPAPRIAPSVPVMPVIGPATLIGTVEARTGAPAVTPPAPQAPIFGSFPTAPAPARTAPVTAEARPPVPPKRRRGLLVFAATLCAITAAASLWVFFGPAPAEPPRPVTPPGELAPIHAAEELAALRKRFAGTYATSGEAGERLLEFRTDGTYQFTEFGTGLARTTNRTGTYTFARRPGETNPVLRTSGHGTVEVRDEKSLSCQLTVFTRLP